MWSDQIHQTWIRIVPMDLYFKHIKLKRLVALTAFRQAVAARKPNYIFASEPLLVISHLRFQGNHLRILYKSSGREDADDRADPITTAL